MRIKFGSDNYIITGDNKKLIEFASVFLNNDMKIHRVLSRNIYLSDTIALNMDAKDIKEVENAFLYIDEKGSMEWLSQCTYEVVTKWKDSKKSAELVDMISNNKKLLDVAARLQKLLAA